MKLISEKEDIYVKKKPLISSINFRNELFIYKSGLVCIMQIC